MTQLDFTPIRNLVERGEWEKKYRVHQIYLSKGKHLCAKCKRTEIMDYEDTITTYLGSTECRFDKVEGMTDKPFADCEIYGRFMFVTHCELFEPINPKQLYHSWIDSDEWKKISREQIKRAGYKCQICGSGMNLATHHITYDHIGCEDSFPDDLLVVCQQCHASIHQTDIANKNNKKG